MSNKIHKSKIEEIIERMKWAVRATTSQELANVLNISASTLSNWPGRGAIPYETIYIFSKEHNVSFHWLLTGEDENTRTNTSYPIEIQDAVDKLIRLLESGHYKIKEAIISNLESFEIAIENLNEIDKLKANDVEKDNKIKSLEDTVKSLAEKLDIVEKDASLLEDIAPPTPTKKKTGRKVA